MEEMKRTGGFVVGAGTRGASGEGDLVVLLSGVRGRPSSPLPSRSVSNRNALH